MEQNPSYQAASSSPDQEIQHILWNRQFSTMFLFLSWVISVHSTTYSCCMSCFYGILFNAVILSSLGLPCSLNPSGSSNKTGTSPPRDLPRALEIPSFLLFEPSNVSWGAQNTETPCLHVSSSSSLFFTQPTWFAKREWLIPRTYCFITVWCPN